MELFGRLNERIRVEHSASRPVDGKHSVGVSYITVIVMSPMHLLGPALAAGFFTMEPPGKPYDSHRHHVNAIFHSLLLYSALLCKHSPIKLCFFSINLPLKIYIPGCARSWLQRSISFVAAFGDKGKWINEGKFSYALDRSVNCSSIDIVLTYI